MTSTALVLHQGLDCPAFHDPQWNGSQGRFRHKEGSIADGFDGSLLNTDIEAVFRWLETSQNPHTKRQKRKEIERFMLWCNLVQGTHLSSASVTEAIAYRSFLQNIPEDWRVEKGKAVRRGPDWRPFTCARLSDASVRQAFVIISDCFAWLVKIRYLSVNCFDQNITRVSQQRDHLKIDNRFLSPRLFQWLTKWLEELEETPEVIRWRFGVDFLFRTGLRDAEFARAKMGDIEREERDGKVRWYINVVGKGKKARRVPVVRLETLMRYRESMGMSPIPLAGEQTPLWLPMRARSETGNVQPASIYASFKKMVRTAALQLQAMAMDEADPETKANLIKDAECLVKVSPHWLRHSFATNAVYRNANLKLVQTALGHSSIATTECYVTVDKSQTYDQLADVDRQTV